MARWLRFFLLFVWLGAVAPAAFAAPQPEPTPPVQPRLVLFESFLRTNG